MSHHFDFIGLYEQFFVLRHLAIGSRDYCKRERLDQKTWRDDHDPENDWAIYKGRLRTMVSNALIESAAKCRVIQDSIEGKLPKAEKAKLDQIACKGLEIGGVRQGKFMLTLRESCNKIIHATEFSFHIVDGRSSKPSYRYSYWNGRCALSGSKGKEKWAVELNVYDWCIAMRDYLDMLGDEAFEW